ncbi:MAG: UbiA family prenyltransferase, partial [Pseudomonadota bacterium]
MSDQQPTLVTDLDGTLIRTDMLLESLLALLKKNFFYIVVMPFWLLRGRSVLKARVAERVNLDVTTLPYRDDVLSYLRDQKASGRQIWLATASHQTIANQIAEHLTLFDNVLGSNETSNLKGQRKADRLSEELKSFSYAGDSSADVPVWQSADAAILVDVSDSLARQIPDDKVEQRFSDERRNKLLELVKACRLHQWAKNALIFVPLLTAHLFTNIEAIVSSALAFLAFGLCASSVYLLNDLLDLPADRQHRTKRNRPFAKGSLPVSWGIFTIPFLLGAAAAIATQLPWQFGLVLAAYYVATTLYSFILKAKAVVDVILLAGLYTTRIVAGAACISVVLSHWLLAFSMFIFLSLALVKRYTEMVELQAAGGGMSTAKGRGYRLDDIDLLSTMGSTSGYLAVLVFALYLNSEVVQSLYQTPYLMWAICPLLLYWISRMWLLAHRKEMNDDPVVF